MARSFQRSPLALAVLVLLYEKPMHPYRMQQLIKERGKDQVINVQRRASLYQTIKQLRREGLITVRETSREENRPERTIYELTEKGLQIARDWLRDMLSTSAQEFPEFPAAVSLLPLLTPADVLCQLEKREAAVTDKLARIDSELRQEGGVLPRLFLLEMEYLRAMLEAELQWVRSLIDDLRSKRITWSEEWLRQFIASDTEMDTGE
ncbi:PadR family transcriptional regulator [Polycladomyces subterraneus]|uniref:PadR family transcriptional regulator n=1 Tax=Polycladomyces subterraneus TaxID=1016997 RepID=A0ABT8IM34_9BACL|nr:PadR family transcriptional regulator [Polycladomyces subterraneus]MDN4593802.1 PadR family transcriptional regulator [Polycladomyces subterraneus]